MTGYALHRVAAERRRRRTAFAALSLAALLVGAPAAGRSENDRLETWRRQALDLVNEERQARGLPQVELGADLNEAAQSHARDMLQRRYYAHTSPEGDDVGDRYVAAGGSRWRLTAENIARCSECKPPITSDTIARLHQGWMNSPHHRENILRSGLDRFGYGIVSDREQGLYAVQTFAGPGRPRGVVEDDAPRSLSRDDVPAEAAALFNRARQRAAAGEVRSSPALNDLAQSLLPDPNSEQVSLGGTGNLFEALPAEQRGKWRALSVVAGACGGCGTQPTDADIRFFRRQWLDDPQKRARLLDQDLTDMGIALQANGTGRKVAIIVLGTRR